MTRPSNALLISRSCSTPEAKAARSASAKASWADPEVRAKRIAALKAAASRSDVKRRRRVAIVLAMRDPETRHKARLACQLRQFDGRRNCNNSPQFQNVIKHLSDARRARVALSPFAQKKNAAQILFALAAYRASLGAAAIEGGVEQNRATNPAAWCYLREAGKPAARRAAARLGGLAQYLAVTAFGVPRHLLASACDLDRRFMRRVCARIEEGRDDHDTDALLARIEARLQ